MSKLLVFGRLAHDTQGILAAIYGLTDMRCERLKYFLVGAVKRRIATFADNEFRVMSHNAELSGTHWYSVSPEACANETAPLPRC